MEQKPRWNWVITLAAVFLAFCLGFGVARWTQHTDGVTVRTARTVPAQTESALPSVPAASAPTEKPTAAPTEAATQPPTEPGPPACAAAVSACTVRLPGSPRRTTPFPSCSAAFCRKIPGLDESPKMWDNNKTTMIRLSDVRFPVPSCGRRSYL